MSLLIRNCRLMRQTTTLLESSLIFSVHARNTSRTRQFFMHSPHAHRIDVFHIAFPPDEVDACIFHRWQYLPQPATLSAWSVIGALSLGPAVCLEEPQILGDSEINKCTNLPQPVDAKAYAACSFCWSSVS